jgi:hypothetical protein
MPTCGGRNRDAPTFHPPFEAETNARTQFGRTDKRCKDGRQLLTTHNLSLAAGCCLITGARKRYTLATSFAAWNWFLSAFGGWFAGGQVPHVRFGG